MAPEAARKYKILIVDDDPDILTTIKLAMTDLGLEVFTATDGLAALDVAEANDPDMMVLDLMLPSAAGSKYCSASRASPT